VTQDDPIVNRLTRIRSSIATTDAAACPEERRDRADRITSATTPSSGTSYTVNAVGNMMARGSDTLAYDQANRLTSTTVGSTTATYTYDGDGKRDSKTVSSTTTAYVYDANRGLPVLLEDGTRRYVWGLGLAYQVEGSAVLVYHVDGLGSVRALTDSTKAVIQTYESDESGVPITASGGSTQPFGFTGEQRDPENGLVYLRARYYDPLPGRFIQRDTSMGQIARPPEMNRFSYVENSPINRRDPTGTKSELLSSCSSWAVGDCTLTVSCNPLTGCTASLTCARKRRPGDRPTEEDCPPSCERACEEEQVRCEQAWWRVEGEVIGDVSDCEHGRLQCESTGGCFQQPGWRRDPREIYPKPIWDQVWWGRKRTCNE
jgi:RHS repeat-associated protein